MELRVVFAVNMQVPRPNWSGFMSSSATGFAELYTKSEIAYLTMVDLNPNDPSCVYYTLLYINYQAK